MPAPLQNPLFQPDPMAADYQPPDLATLWVLLEQLTEFDPQVRLDALNTLGEGGAIGRFPLAAHLVAGLLTDRDVSLRCGAIRRLGSVVAGSVDTGQHALRVREIIAGAIGNYGHHEMAALLMGSLEENDLRGDLGRLFNLNAVAGELLADVVGDRSIPLAVRSEAVFYIGQLGFVEAMPTLERIAVRLEARQSGQGAMPFAPPLNMEDLNLLKPIREAIEKLYPYGVGRE